VALLPTAQLDSWGWRIPFFVGAALALVILVARSGMHESPEFERQRREGSIPATPLRHVLRNHPLAVARTFAISALGSITYYVGITYVPAFLHARGHDEGDALWLSTIAAVAVIAITPLCGALSDRVGRRPVLLGLTCWQRCCRCPCSRGWRRRRRWASRWPRCAAGLRGRWRERGGGAGHGRAVPRRRPGQRAGTGRDHGHGLLRRCNAWLAQWWVERSGWAAAPAR
jgi:MHS family proline/betaine transporter-like MFS transporter